MTGQKLDKAKPPVRLPQRSEAVSGNEAEGVTPIAAAQKKKPKRKIAKAKPAPKKR